MTDVVCGHTVESVTMSGRAGEGRRRFRGTLDETYERAVVFRDEHVVGRNPGAAGVVRSRPGDEEARRHGKARKRLHTAGGWAGVDGVAPDVGGDRFVEVEDDAGLGVDACAAGATFFGRGRKGDEALALGRCL